MVERPLAPSLSRTQEDHPPVILLDQPFLFHRRLNGGSGSDPLLKRENVGELRHVHLQVAGPIRHGEQVSIGWREPVQQEIVKVLADDIPASRATMCDANEQAPGV